MHILVVEDHRDVADTLRMGLEEYGFRVDLAPDGLDGEVKARTNTYRLLVVDWMLPGQNGIQLIRRLRNGGITTPILMITARAEKQDQIEALDAGADDYLTKPFSFEVLLARLRALSRRGQQAPAPAEAALRLHVGALHLDLRERTALVGTTALDLREKEYQLLTLMAEHANRVLTRTVLADRVWGSMFVTDDVLNTTIGSLRRKLHRATNHLDDASIKIETLRSVGYRLKVSAGTDCDAAY